MLLIRLFQREAFWSLAFPLGFTAEPITACLLTQRSCSPCELDVFVRAQLLPLVCEFLYCRLPPSPFPGMEQTFNK